MIDFHSRGYHEYRFKAVFFFNAALLLNFISGAACCYLASAPLAVIFAVFYLAYFIVPVKRKCINCFYYGKYCYKGCGVFAVKLFSSGDVHEFGLSYGKWKQILYFSPILTLCIFSFLYAIIAAEKPMFITILTFFIFVITGLVYMILKRLYACRRCKMKNLCESAKSVNEKKAKEDKIENNKVHEKEEGVECID